MTYDPPRDSDLLRHHEWVLGEVQAALLSWEPKRLFNSMVLAAPAPFEVPSTQESGFSMRNVYYFQRFFKYICESR